MATWEDGPEFAPVERPSGFAAPRAEPLVAPAATPSASADAPQDRPTFTSPSVPTPALAALVPHRDAGRNPHEAFAVVSSTMTSGATWGSMTTGQPGPAAAAWTPQQPISTTQATGRGADLSSAVPLTSAPIAAPPTAPWAHPAVAQPFDPAALPPPPPSARPVPLGTNAPPPAGGYVPPTAGQYPPPTAQYPPPAQPPFPAPGTPAWFAPGSQPPQRTPPTPGDASAVTIFTTATPGVMFPLLIGAFFAVVAPIMLVIAWVFSRRMTLARGPINAGFAVCASILGLVGVAAALGDPYWAFDDWWNGVGAWGVVFCWVMLVVVAFFTRAALVRGERPQP